MSSNEKHHHQVAAITPHIVAVTVQVQQSSTEVIQQPKVIYSSLL